MIHFDIVVAMDEANGIGKDGGLPWRLPGDLKHFKTLTTATQDPSKKNVVIMGRKTWDSLGPAVQPLPNRINIVLSRIKHNRFPESVILMNDFQIALLAAEKLQIQGRAEHIFIIGGAEIFTQAIQHPGLKTLHITRILGSFPCDVFFPGIPKDFHQITQSPIMEESHFRYTFMTYSRNPAH